MSGASFSTFIYLKVVICWLKLLSSSSVSVAGIVDFSVHCFSSGCSPSFFFCWFLLDYTNYASLSEFPEANLASWPDETVDKGIDWLSFWRREGFHRDKDIGATRHSFQQSAHHPPSFISFLHLAKLFPEVFQYGLHCTVHAVVIQGEIKLF